MATYRKQKFERTTVLLDGNEYFDCSFSACRIVISRGGFRIDGATFNHCEVDVQGDARSVADFVLLMATQGVIPGSQPKGNAMKIKLVDSSIDATSVGISVPKEMNNLDLHIERSAISGSRGIEVRDPPSLYERLGLPPSVNPKDVIDAINALQQASADAESRAKAVTESKLVKSLSGAAQITTVTRGLIDLVNSGMGQAAIQMLSVIVR